MPANLTPEQLAQLLALMQGQGMTGNGASQWSGAGDLADWTVDQRRDVIGRTGGDAGTEIYSDPITRLYQSTGADTWKTNGETADVFDAQGNYIGPSSGDSDALAMAKFIASAVGSYYGANALNGAMGGASAGGGAGTTAAGSTAAGGAAEGSALADIMAGGGYGGGTGATMTGGSTLTSGGGNTVLGTTLGDVDIMQAAGGGANWFGNQRQQSGSGMNWGNALGALAGAASGRDQTQSSNRDPWAPAQPFLQQQIAQGQQMADRYQQQPFSQAQQTAYSNYGGLLDAINSNAGGLLGGMNASASGANNFDRSNPRKQLQPGGGINLSQWLPGLLGNLGTGGR